MAATGDEEKKKQQSRLGLPGIPMRRNEKEITDRAAIDAVIRDSSVCRLAMSRGNRPHVVPLCFGYDGSALYFHSAREGEKIEILQENANVCFEFDILDKVVESPDPCAWGVNYRSVIGTGRASFVEGREARKRALDLIMKQYSGRCFDYAARPFEKTLIIKVEIESLTGKASGYGKPDQEK